MGENFMKATRKRLIALITHAHQVLLPLRAMLIMGTRIKDTTTGLIPLNILTTTGLS